MRPCLIVSDKRGKIFDIPELEAIGRSGKNFLTPGKKEWIPLPPGSDLMELPGRLPVGIEVKTQKLQVINDSLWAVAAFTSPAHTITLLAAWKTRENSEPLPLYAYGAVGWFKNRFQVCAMRIDPDIRQEPHLFYENEIAECTRKILKTYGRNRLARHLAENCVMKYRCPAARNFVLGRWEMPVPTAPHCNARCIGCISHEPAGGVKNTQNRISFIPDAGEIVEITVPHLESADRAVASFGQGCEGEPLTNPELLMQAIKEIRKKTSKGTINLNSNASNPAAIERLCAAGLDSLRVSINSFRKEFYEAYFRPIGYSLEQVFESVRIMKNNGRFVSINYFVLPGFTDQPSEVELLVKFLKEENINMIQWRNLNMDPELYWNIVNPTDENSIGIRNLINKVKIKFPGLRHGYFNPYLGRDIP
jgi:pyruvate-formate lyase-activating enzyme